MVRSVGYLVWSEESRVLHHEIVMSAGSLKRSENGDNFVESS